MRPRRSRGRRLPPADLVTAVHVRYFWHDPLSVLVQPRTVLAGSATRREAPSTVARPQLISTIDRRSAAGADGGTAGRFGVTGASRT